MLLASNDLVALLVCLMTHTVIESVRIEPNFEVSDDRIVAIWSTDRKFLICSPDKKEFGGSVRWYGPSGRLVGVSPLSSVYQVEAVSQRSSKLFFVQPYKASAGVYKCTHIRNNTEVNSESVEIKIYNPIDMSDNLDQYTIDEGNTLEIECSAKFDSEIVEAQVLWIEDLRNKRNLSRHKTDIKHEDLNLQEKRIKNTLIIEKVSASDEGFYQCQALYSNNYLGDIGNTQFEVVVQQRPKIVGSPRTAIWVNEQVESDEDHFLLDLVCQAYADPAAQFSWVIGRNNLTNEPQKWPPFVSLQNKPHLSLLRVHLRTIEKFKGFVRQLKENLTDIWCEATNVYGSDALHFDIDFGTLPDSPEIIYFNKEPGFIFLELNYTESSPPIDKFKLQLSKSNYIVFNHSQQVDQAKTGHLFKIPYDPNVGIEYLDLLAHNPVGWSRPSVVMQDTTQGLTTEEPYEHKLSNVQISVLLFIVFLFITSTSVQVIYFNWCVDDEDTY